MDENVTFSKEQKRTSLFLSFSLSALLLTNGSFVITRQDKFSGFMPISIVLCAASVVLAVIGLFSVIRNYKMLNEKKRSVFCAIAVLALCGLECYMGVTAVNDMNAKRNAEKDAVLFIKDKYGIEAEAEYEKTSTGVDTNIKWTTVKMTADGKDFTVEIRTKIDDNTRLADDYQIDEIKQAVFDEVSQVYPNGALRDVEIYGSDFLGARVVERYFDGTNLDEVMECQHGSITVDFADTEFDLDNPLFERLGELSIRPYFTSFDTAEHLEEFFEKNGSGIVYIRDERYAEYAHYITDRVVFEYGEAGEKGKVVRKSYNN